MSISPDVIVDETSFMARALASPSGWHDTKETAKERLARSLRVSVHTVDRIIRGRNKRIDAHLYLTLKQKYDAWERRQILAAEADMDAARGLRRQIERAQDATDEGGDAAPQSVAGKGAVCMGKGGGDRG